MSNVEIGTRDWLALERTRLANERTFLAYFRTAFSLLGTGVAILSIDALSELKTFGIILIALAPVMFGIGMWRMLSVKKQLKNRYKIK